MSESDRTSVRRLIASAHKKLAPDERTMLRQLYVDRSKSSRTFEAVTGLVKPDGAVSAVIVTAEQKAQLDVFDRMSPADKQQVIDGIPVSHTRLELLAHNLKRLGVVFLQDSESDIGKRRAIVRAHPDLQASELCVRFDEAGVPLTKSTREWETWKEAYKSPYVRPRIDSLIHRDRKVATKTKLTHLR